MQELIKHNGELFKYVDGGIIHGYTKARIQEEDPFIGWRGAKMPHAMWQSILAFFIWTFDTTKKGSSCADEALVYLFYNEKEHSWLAWAPPQRGSGMTVKSVEEHPNWKQQEAFDGYIRIGTGHHHCSSKAFQSGTDHSDEEKGNGLHFTIGELDKNTLDVHARVVFNGNMIVLEMEELADWIEIADKYKKLKLPPELIFAANWYSFKGRPPEGFQFPETWKENFLKWDWKNPGGIIVNNYSDPPPQGETTSTGYWSNANGVKEWRRYSDAHLRQGSNTQVGFHGVSGQSRLDNTEMAEIELESMLTTGGIDLIQLSLVATEMAKLARNQRDKTPIMDRVNKLLIKYGLNPRWLEKWIFEQSMGKEQAQAWMGGA